MWSCVLISFILFFIFLWMAVSFIIHIQKLLSVQSNISFIFTWKESQKINLHEKDLKSFLIWTKDYGAMTRNSPGVGRINRDRTKCVVSTWGSVSFLQYLQSRFLVNYFRLSLWIKSWPKHLRHEKVYWILYVT